MKVVINVCFGGFGLSKEAMELLGNPEEPWDISRTDPRLIEVVETLGHQANGDCARLKIVEIPEGVDWYIDEYDGSESIHEKHRSWS